MRLGDVARPDAGREAIRRVVGDPDGVGLVLELRHSQDRADDLLAGDPPIVVDAVEDRRRDVAAAGFGTDALTTRDDACALALAQLDIVEHLVQLPSVAHRAEARAGVEWVDRGDTAAHLGDALDELLANGTMDDEPRARVTRLPAVVEDPPADTLGRLLDVRDVGEHDLRALPAELERDRLHVRVADPAQERLADLGRPGERDLVHPGMPRQRLTED